MDQTTTPKTNLSLKTYIQKCIHIPPPSVSHKSFLHLNSFLLTMRGSYCTERLAHSFQGRLLSAFFVIDWVFLDKKIVKGYICILTPFLVYVVYRVLQKRRDRFDDPEFQSFFFVEIEWGKKIRPLLIVYIKTRSKAYLDFTAEITTSRIRDESI